MHKQHELERYLRFELPFLLNLSPSKQVACDHIFYHFSDWAKELAETVPDEFDRFFEGFKSQIDEISKWRCPKTHKIIPVLVDDSKGNVAIAKSKNGRLVYRMCEKPTKATT